MVPSLKWANRAQQRIPVVVIFPCVVSMRAPLSSESVVYSASPNEFYEIILRDAGGYIPAAVDCEISAPGNGKIKTNIGGLFASKL